MGVKKSKSTLGFGGETDLIRSGNSPFSIKMITAKKPSDRLQWAHRYKPNGSHPCNGMGDQVNFSKWRGGTPGWGGRGKQTKIFGSVLGVTWKG